MNTRFLIALGSLTCFLGAVAGCSDDDSSFDPGFQSFTLSGSGETFEIGSLVQTWADCRRAEIEAGGAVAENNCFNDLHLAVSDDIPLCLYGIDAYAFTSIEEGAATLQLCLDGKMEVPEICYEVPTGAGAGESSSEGAAPNSDGEQNLEGGSEGEFNDSATSNTEDDEPPATEIVCERTVSREYGCGRIPSGGADAGEAADTGEGNNDADTGERTDADDMDLGAVPPETNDSNEVRLLNCIPPTNVPEPGDANTGGDATPAEPDSGSDGNDAAAG